MAECARHPGKPLPGCYWCRNRLEPPAQLTLTPAETGEMAFAVTDLGRLALVFAGIDRTACWHPDGRQRESDTDHTVMLAWVAPALAQALYPNDLDVGLVCQFAVIHDMPEVYAGDTPTLRITPEGREAKEARERAATDLLTAQFRTHLPYVGAILSVYEEQQHREARFVRAVDKILPKIIHLLDGAKGLIEEGMTVAELRAIFDRQALDVAGYAGEFTALLQLRGELADRTIRVLAAKEKASA